MKGVIQEVDHAYDLECDLVVLVRFGGVIRSLYPVKLNGR